MGFMCDISMEFLTNSHIKLTTKGLVDIDVTANSCSLKLLVLFSLISVLFTYLFMYVPTSLMQSTQTQTNRFFAQLQNIYPNNNTTNHI